MFNFKRMFYVIFLLCICRIEAELPTKRLCANEACTEPISIAKTLQGYPSPDKSILSFPPNVEVKIFSKPASSNSNLWEGEINGKKGFVPSTLIREVKVLKKAKFEVDVTTNEVPQSADNIKPNNVQPNYEVVDGTTIYMDAAESVTEAPVAEVTATPDLNATDSASQQTDEGIQTTPSLVDGVLSSINSWIPGGGGDQSSKELDDDDDEGDDDDDDEEEDDEDESEVEEDSEETLDVLQGKNEEKVVEEAGNIETKKQTETNDKLEDIVKQVAVDSVETVPQENVEDKIEGASSLETVEKVTEANGKGQEKSHETESTSKVVSVSETKEEPIETEASKNEIDETKSLLDEPKSKSSDDVPSSPNNDVKLEVIPAGVVLPNLQSDSQTKDKLTNEHPTTEDTLRTEVPTENVVNNAEQISTAPTTEDTVQTEVPPENIVDNAEISTVAPEEIATTEIPTEEEEQVTDLPIIENITEDPLYANKDVVESAETSKESEKPAEEAPKDVAVDEPPKSQEPVETQPEDTSTVATVVEQQEQSSGIMSDIYNSMFGSTPAPEDSVETEKLQVSEENIQDTYEDHSVDDLNHVKDDKESLGSVEENQREEHIHVPLPHEVSKQSEGVEQSCTADSDCPDAEDSEIAENSYFSDFNMDVTHDFVLVIVTTAATVLTFLLGYIYIDKSRKEAPLIAKINKLEKELLIALKENQMLSDGAKGDEGDGAVVTNEMVEKLTVELALTQQAKASLEEQIENLEKELENSTEVALELNRMLTDVLSSQNGSDTLIANVEQLQRQLVEQQDTINSVNEMLSERNTENHELRLELDISNKKVTELQAELDKMVLNLLKIEEEKDQQQTALETEIASLKERLNKLVEQSGNEVVHLRNEIRILQHKFSETQRNVELKTSELKLLEDSLKDLKGNNAEALKSLLEVNSVKAELQQLKREKQTLSERLSREQEGKSIVEKQLQSSVQEFERLKQKYEEADREKLEAQTKLQVLSVYFKEKEAQLQKELNKQEAMWNEQKGEATSTIERIKYMQEELQNYKAQNESLKQEIVAQEVELKSQISILEKKAHENWVSARQAERRLEEAKHEAAQLRNRLTLRERNVIEEKGQNRIQSPLEQNGDLTVSPLHMPPPVDTPASPPLLFGARDHMTTSPPLPGLPPFLPPPPGVPFMPPPLPPGVPPPPFMPPPPTLFPGDHRPPPLGRMSSPPPPLNSRYSPDSRAFSPYDRNSPSPPYDSEYGASSPPPPPMHRGYSPYNNRSEDRRDYKRPPPLRNTTRHNKGSAHSSASGNSNESLEKINRNHNKV